MESKEQEKREKKASFSRHGRVLKSFSKSPEVREIKTASAIKLGGGKSHVRFKLDTPLIREKSKEKNI